MAGKTARLSAVPEQHDLLEGFEVQEHRVDQRIDREELSSRTGGRRRRAVGAPQVQDQLAPLFAAEDPCRDEVVFWTQARLPDGSPAKP